MSSGLTSAIDYLALTGSFGSHDSFRGWLGQFLELLPLGDQVIERRDRSFFNGRRFNHSISSIAGLMGGFSFDEDDRLEFSLTFPGRFCRQLPTHDYYGQVLTFLRRPSVKLTRIDLAFDDFSRRSDFSLVTQAGELGQYRYVDSFKVIRSKSCRSDLSVPTCYFGKSDKVIRFYDADYVHGIPADRWELQLRDDHAGAWLSQYNGSFSLGQFLTGAVDFGYSNHSHHFKRFAWWQSIFDEVGGSCPLKLPSFEPCFRRSYDWLLRQAAPTIAVACDGFSSQDFQAFINSLVEAGRDRHTSYHRAWVEQLKKEDFSYYG